MRKLGKTVVNFYNHGKFDKSTPLMSVESQQRELCERLGITYTLPPDLVLTVDVEYTNPVCTIQGQEVDKRLFSNVLTSIHEYKGNK